MTDVNGNVVPYNRDGVVQVQKLKAKRAAEAKAKRAAEAKAKRAAAAKAK